MTEEKHVPSGYRRKRGMDGLTEREREVLVRVITGESDQCIAQAMSISKQRVSALVAALSDRGYMIRVRGKTYVSPSSPVPISTDALRILREITALHSGRRTHCQR